MENLSKIIKERAVIRATSTKICRKLSERVLDESAAAEVRLLEEKQQRLTLLDNTILGLMLEADTAEEDIQREVETADSYKVQVFSIISMFEKVSKESISSAKSTIACHKPQLKLPEIKLIKFNGDVRNWISFWGQFQKIHLDSQIDDHDKFQYLLGAIPEDTPARSLIESFPPSAKNYPKAIEQLIQRFGREDLLIEVYMRDLLSLVLLQAKKQPTSLSSLYDKLTTQLRALESMGLTSEKYAVMLYPLVESAIPEELLRVWEREVSRGTFKSHKGKILTDLLEFLKQEVESGQRINLARGSFNEEKTNSTPSPPTTSCFVAGPSGLTTRKDSKLSSEIDINKDKCIWCDKQWHSSMQCSKAATLSQDERRSHIKKLKACANCLKLGHNSFKCRMFIKCLACLKRHNVLFCPDLAKINNKSSSDVKTTENNKTSLTSNLSSNESVTLLQTLLIKILHDGKEFVVRALIDSGAQRSYIKHDLAQKINLPVTGEQKLSHIVFGGTKMNLKAHNIYKITVANLDDSFQCCLSVLDEIKICGDIPRVYECDLLEKLWKHGVILTDVGRHIPEIEILIGADYCGMLLSSQIIQLDNGLTAVNTKLGWTLQGMKSSAGIGLVTTSLHITSLWDLDVLGIQDPAESKTKKVIEEEVMAKFKQSIIINNESRYEVKLPWKDGCNQLLNNRELAEKRLSSTTKRLTSTGYYEAYDKVFTDWEAKGIIEEVHEDDTNGHYLAHHPVIKVSSATTPVRPVFDASGKDYSGNSLNSCLEKGVNLLELIPKMLIQFRLNPVGVTADIEKAFLQISLDMEDRKFLKFLWWKKNGSEDIKIYRHCRVVFGLTCSPFLLGATIKHHLERSSPEFIETADILLRSFYVDNCILSLEEKKVEKFVTEAKDVMGKGQFNLREWVIAPMAGHTPQKTVVSVLGVTWNTQEDVIYVNVNMPSTIPAKITRRALLSITQRVFDPIGFTAPCTLIPKLLMQRTWSVKGGWDDELPEYIAEKFVEWWEQTHYLSKCHIPRRLTNGTTSLSSAKLSLHVFSDASLASYATCIFLRSEHDGKVSVQLVLAKSRVAPTKQKVTIPRLELLAALIATRLCTQVKTALQLDCPVHYWTDSTVVLTWIKGGTWAVFVENRVKEIREYSNVREWNFVPGSMNPADLPSRGCDSKTLLESSWWEGPRWLYSDKSVWPQIVCEGDREANAELKKSTHVTELTTCATIPDFTERLLYFSQYPKLLRMFAWILRFINKTNKSGVNIGALTCVELELAEKKLFKYIQGETYQEAKSKINLTTYKDADGILRVQTKLLLSDEPENFKWPILLPGKHPIVERLVQQRHKTLSHAGVNTLMSVLRERFWIIGIRRLAKKVVSCCVICRRYKAKPGTAPFAPLPRNRLNCYAAAFEICGIDYAGPLILKSREKAYIVLFTCAVYRAVHLELTTSLTTDAFLMALRRFIARRGRVSVIYTDNGANFVGASNLLKGINWSELQTSPEIQPIKWIFNPPSAAWWGGWWERLVRSIKELLRRVLGRAVVTYVELETILCDCEAVVNDRPLTYVTESDDLVPITPNSFLQSLPRNEIPEIDLINAKSLNQRTQYVQKLRNDLRQRFRSEYISSLVQKGRENYNNPIEEGDVVLIETPEKKVNWPLGVVLQIHHGRDGAGRVATVKTSSGILTRPIQRLYLLEHSSRAGGCSE